MNEELKNRFDELASATDNEKLDWSTMGPSIRAALEQPKRKRRVLFWWWGGAACVLLFAGLLSCFFLSQGGIPSHAEATAIESFASPATSDRISAENQVVKPTLLADAGEASDLVFEDKEEAGFRSSISKRGSPSNVNLSGKVRDFSEVKYPLESTQGGGEANVNERFASTDLNSVRGAAVTTGKIGSTANVQISEISEVAATPLVQERRTEAAQTLVLPKGESYTALDQPILHLIENTNKILELPMLNLSVDDNNELGTRGENGLTITAYTGGHVANAAQAYGQFEDFLGLTVGADLEYQTRKGWFAGVGLRTDRIQFSTQASLVDTVREFRPGQVETVYTFSSGPPVIAYSDTISVQQTRNILHHNTQTDYSIPVYLGYRWALGKWGVGLRAGGNIILSQRLVGRMLSVDNEVLKVDQRNRNMMITPQFGGDFSYQILEDVSLCFRTSIHQTLGVSTTAIPQPDRFWLQQFTFGIRYSL